MLDGAALAAGAEADGCAEAAGATDGDDDVDGTVVAEPLRSSWRKTLLVDVSRAYKIERANVSRKKNVAK